VRVRTKGGEAVSASLVVAADGRSSPAREAARITTTTWRYPQVALTAIFAHDMPHKDTSTEFHTRQGPCTFVPLPGTAEHPNRSSLVWMMSPEEADRRAALPAEAFAREASETGLRHLGALRLISQRGRVPMQGLTARRLTGARIALVGEAAHAFPPIGAQGLNLGLRDVAALVNAAEAADPGAADGLATYDRSRASDVRTRTGAVDALNRSLLSDLLPVDFARGLGLLALDSFAPLRRFVMRQGLTPLGR
jgi:2-octaprenyl-6-methoxyphenol hydroxylase